MDETPEERAERERFEAWHASLPIDDEPLTEGELAAIEAAKNGTATYISLDEYFERRAARTH